ncbi:MAG: hypothetical protein IJ071_10910 [Ruminococcus sp.]|nr:hypothetical protein [Ruminococcus sp.]
MKKIIAILLALAVTGGLFSCGPERAESSREREHSASEEETTEGPTEEETEEETEPAEPTEQSCHKSFDSSESQGITRITLTAKCSGDLRKEAVLDDVSGHVIHMGVVGRFGLPFELSYTDNVTDAQLSFTYDKEELRGVPEENLMVLFYNEDEEAIYDEIPGSALDKENCTVTVNAEKPGVYILVDAYQWLDAWGDSRAESYAYDKDPTAYPTDWERSCDTGSIMELADKQWAVENAPLFHVSTPEQLASAVYYINGLNSSNVSIVLDADIDLTGYDWVPMGWNSSGNTAFSGSVDGGGHKITGMKIEGSTEVGFIGYGLGCTVSDITFENAEVSGGAQVGIVGGEVYMTDTWENVHVSGKITGAYDDYGGIVGREASLNFVNCFADVEINGEKSDFLSYRQKVITETEVVETFTLTLNEDNSITRDDHEGFRNLCWQIDHNGQGVLQRGATDPHTDEPELTLDPSYVFFGGSDGKTEVYLTAFINGTYIRVSNIITVGQ